MDNGDQTDAIQPDARPFRVIGLNYMSLYLDDLQAAVDFYTRVFGPPEDVEIKSGRSGWRMGSTWLTLFPSQHGTHPDSNPRNAEFAIQVAAPGGVDALHASLIQAGAKDCWTPEDTAMYEPMRFACVDDPFGVRIDIYCPLNSDPS